MADFLHERSDFGDLLALVAERTGIVPTLVEKDYWVMHCLWGLQAQGFTFELKGGTSLSKGFGVIHRFSEDIDIRFEPPPSMGVKTGRNHDKPAHIESRRAFYDWLCAQIRIPGLIDVERDTAYDDKEKLRNGGIRLRYPSRTAELPGVKTGILLEAGFDDTTPNRPVTISSWAFDAAAQAGVSSADNRAVGIRCYAPAYTFVEKLQTISTKYRRLTESQVFDTNFLRHYYDVYCLLALPEVQDFLGTPAYAQRKAQRFRSADEPVIAKNSAFQLADALERARFCTEYRRTAALYYAGQPSFDEILARIGEFIERM